MTSKRKTKQLRWLVTMILLVTAMAMPSSTWAQEKVMYTVYDNGKLTFMYGEKPGSGDVYDVPTDPKDPDWLEYNESIMTVVFDESFKDARPTSCYKWFYNCRNLTSIDNIENLNTEEVTNMSYMFDNCSSLTSLDVSKFNTAKVTNMSFMFRGCSGLTSLDVSKFNTAEVTHMGDMFRWCSGLTSLDLSSFNTAKVENMSVMFGGCWKLTTIYVSDDFTIGKVSGSDNMFEGCNQLEGATSYNSGKTDKNMANFDGYFTPKNITPYVKWDANAKVLTFKVANTKEEGSGVYDLNEGANALEWVGEVYSDCEKVVFTPSFKQARPTSCCQWFLGFSQLTTIEGIENLNTEKVTDMSEMFNSCSGLKNLDLSSFNTAKVENMSYMFGGCYDLISLDLSSFNTAKVTDMTWMFYNCQSLTTIYASDGFTTVEVSSSDGMFESCFVLEGATSWDLGKTDKSMANFDGYFTPKTITPYVKWDASTKVLTFKVANNKEEGAYDLNQGANKPKWVGVVSPDCEKVVFTPSFIHAKPTSCYLWFEGFEQLTTIEGIENLNTEEVTNMSGMFGGCSGLTSLDVSKFNTAEVENMSFMFYICSSLTSLDVSKFNTAKVTDMANMFGGCSGLTSLDLSSFNTAKVENMTNMFDICRELTSLDLSSFNTAKVTVMSEMFKNCSGLTTIYVSDDFKIGYDTNGDNMFYDCKSLKKGNVSYDSGKTDKDMANYNTGYFTKSNLTPYVKWDANTKVLTFKVANTKEEGVYDLNQGANDPGWLENNNCEKVVFTSSFNHAKPTSCYKWFKDFGQLTTIQGIENLNTEEVKNMSEMFNSCSGLTSLTLSSFNTDKVENMSYMFYNCQSLESLILSSFNTDNVTDMRNMFSGCSGLENLDLSKFNTDKVENMFQMFYGCSGLTSLNLSNFDTAKVTDMGDMFYECSGLTSLDVSKFNTANVTTMSSMFNYCSGLTSLNLSNFNTDNVTDMSFMFNNCQKLTSLNLSNFNTANVTNMRYMFNGCSGLTSLNLSSFNTAKVEDMYQMFWGCSSLESLNLSSFNTAKVTNMGSMFKGCSGLTSLNLSSFNTAKVENMYQMFTNCSSLTSLNLSSFNTANVTTMDYMFNGCSSLESLNLSSFNTAKVTNMGSMFKGCSGLPSLDLSSFNTAKVEHMDNMFRDCSGLTKIYVSDDFTTEHNPSGSSMFKDCSTSLKGAAQYDSNKTDLSMANYNTGYFKTYFTLGDSKVELCREPLTTDILDLSGEKDFVAHAPFTANTATYSRDLSSSKSTWFSLCLPFAYTPDNFTAYQLKGASADAVEIEEISGTIAAGTPVLFKFNDGANKIINLSATGANIVKAPVEGATVNGDDGSSLQLYGTYQTKTFSSEDNNAFILLNNKLMNPAKMLATGVTNVGVKPFRAYMTLTASAQTSSARAFFIGHGGEEGTTAIDLLNSVATDDAEYYDINGRRIDAPAKGVNIVRRGNKTMKLIIK